jgi:hypothetical protein
MYTLTLTKMVWAIFYKLIWSTLLFTCVCKEIYSVLENLCATVSCLSKEPTDGQKPRYIHIYIHTYLLTYIHTYIHIIRMYNEELFSGDKRFITRVARWFVFKPKIPIWVNFWGPYIGECLYILWPFVILEIFYIWPFGTFCIHFVHFFRFWYHVPRKIWQLCSLPLDAFFGAT